jgi:hypothetical protein
MTHEEPVSQVLGTVSVETDEPLSNGAVFRAHDTGPIFTLWPG